MCVVAALTHALLLLSRFNLRLCVVSMSWYSVRIDCCVGCGVCVPLGVLRVWFSNVGLLMLLFYVLAFVLA